MVSRLEPPKTARPTTALVKALESPDRGTAFLSYMLSVLEPGPWRWDTDGGFAWVPYTTRHELRIERVVNEQARRQRTFCISTFTVVDGLSDITPALAIANALNQRNLGGCAYVNIEPGELRVATIVELDPQSWFGAYVFEQAVMRLVGILETASARLARECGGTPVAVAHPTLGLRSEPDQLVTDTPLITRQPEAGTGLWWSKPEIEAFRSGIAYFVSQHDPIAAASIDTDRFDAVRSANNFDLEVDMTSPVGNMRLTVKETEHHEIGTGLEFLLSTPITFGFHGERGSQTSANESFDALWAANLINMVNGSTAYDTTVPLLASGWSAWQGQMSLSTYLPVEIPRMLQQIAANVPAAVGLAPRHVGGAFSVMSFWHVLRITELAELVNSDRQDVEFESIDDFFWDGTAENALTWSMLSDSSRLIGEIAAGRPVNRVFDVVDLGDNAWMLPHQLVPARFGVFNPMGPSVGTIEVCIDYAQQRALLLERLRHPTSPSLRLHAVIDRAGLDVLNSLVGDVIARLEWSTFDWFELNSTLLDDLTPAANALRSRAAGSTTTTASTTEALIATIGDPWTRLNGNFEPSGVIPTDADPAEYWVAVLLEPANIDGHLAYLRSAWEGAHLAARGDFAQAQQVAQACMDEIMRRGGTQRQLAEQ